ncbi:alpha/beta fold hydrolase [Pseudofrankia inefficax]|uniref:Alpha/beta hydrolase fold protein n=1 Tax=Pseudofrankia inefficax (strain DSM 45817 / CECT 9037 / DDB 130130 / EuI1c) TaxID=298654 RepID=E3J405_PSEI1|nr:alpha/beta hydrolase [Pseudofrankia inefficax]ADP80638.1 alpha/beta hydrolase fold protein [Pseudofrankia inefficax]
MSVAYAHNGSVELAYERIGAPDGEPLLLVTGLGGQLLDWPDGFCAALAAEGFSVIRFDNRDSGLSTHFDDRAAPSHWSSLARGRSRRAPYEGTAFADDAVAVMDAAGWPSAHVVGISMGAAIAQLAAVRHPRRVRSMSLIGCLPPVGVRTLFHLRYGVFVSMARKRFPETREGAGERMVALARALASPGHPFDEEWAREVGLRCHDRRPHDMRAERRQLAAARAARGWKPGRISVPTTVLYGADDPIIRPGGARAVARAIPGARLRTHPDMGHEIPENRWPDLVADIVATTAEAPGVAAGLAWDPVT